VVVVEDLKMIKTDTLVDLVVERIITVTLLEVETQGIIILLKDMLGVMVEQLQTTLVVVVVVLVKLAEMLVVHPLVMEVMDYLIT
tara:strand:+ start:48 stop:302 length:255 start_codon:yes stop_codon:yes gene_type:complete